MLYLMEVSLNKLFEESAKKNWDCPALSDYKGITLHYRDVARRIEKLHIIVSMCGLNKGDKVAICSKNQANWGVVFMSRGGSGPVPVRRRHEFRAGNVPRLGSRSEGRRWFAGG